MVKSLPLVPLLQIIKQRPERACVPQGTEADERPESDPKVT